MFKKESSQSGVPVEKTLRIDLAQMEIEPGRPDLNTKKILEIIERQREWAAQLIVFPEMAVPGYMIGDMWGSKSFLEDLQGYDQEIAAASQGMAVIWGNADTDFTKVNRDGTPRKYNAAKVAQNGRLLPDKIYKTNLPTYRQFHDARFFTSLADYADELERSFHNVINPVNLTVEGVQYKIGVLLCEDMWWKDYGRHRNIADILAYRGAELMVNLSCSPWGLRKNNKRHRVVSELFTGKEKVPFLYVNNVGCQDIGKTVFGFDGGTTIYDKDAQVLAEAKPYQEDVLTAEYADGKILAICVGLKKSVEFSEIKEVKTALVSALKSFCERKGIKKVVNGLSGGIDSAVTTCLWVEVLGAENVFTVNMPTKFNSSQTRDAARVIAENLGVYYSVVPIQGEFENEITLLQDTEFTRTTDIGTSTREVKLSAVNLENIQARIRGSNVLAGLASALGAVVSCNGNKTEMAFGYATLYGDTVGAISPIGDLYKKQVFDMARLINQEAGREIIPADIIEKLKPSAELSEDQNVDKGLGDPFYYDYHDAMVKSFVERLERPEDIMAGVLEGELEKKWNLPEGAVLAYFGGSRANLIADLEKRWKEIHNNVFKRFQCPPVIKVSSRAFGYDFHESQNSPYFSRKYLALRDQYLAV